MSHFVRASKYRHVYVQPPKTGEAYSNIRLSTAVGEQNYIKANPKYFAVALSGGGGPFTCIPFEAIGALPAAPPVFSGHTSNVLDFDFSPFHDHLIASGAEDTTVKVWGIPEGGLKESIAEPLVDLRAHERKVTLLRFHPTAANVLASVSADGMIKLWDVEGGQEGGQCHVHQQLVQDVQWDYRGNTFATTCKDKVLRVLDGRTGRLGLERKDAHEGSKSSKCVFLGDREMLLTVGFTKQSRRQLKIWDLKNLKQEVKTLDIDQAAGAIMPFFDSDTNLLYLAGKGDGNIRYYEIVSEAPFVFPISEYRSTTPSKGCCLVPKRGLDVLRCETARVLKLTTSSVEPLSFIVPRKGGFFQDDLFPPSMAGLPSHSAPEWWAGSDKAPLLMSLDPAVREGGKEGGKDMGWRGVGSPLGSSGGSLGNRPPSGGGRTTGQLQKELDVALARISLLESRLKAAGLECS
ncbi:hypothetical protein NSK_007719 [Nannochloropsis salina CCMP1776]|uniref:Coronin n=1 Tax=Nannochloropsis salina CCMP1776 TaxID=1027361 RepID=A0A4D9CQL4_9STRA|nr:hypothetical protein NSK_007719 [Nannochloropsis salina CCMP1776]|eukprot:TFJ81076.1 hypothetical protein NSK_007719 [Nannochloropsis salina CCMP1776]